VLIASPKLGATTVAELIDKAKADPGGIAYGSQGIGATSHLTTALFETMAGVKFTHVPSQSRKAAKSPTKPGVRGASVSVVSRTAARGRLCSHREVEKHLGEAAGAILAAAKGH
jgi:tripartite-type tricarboxylate transporter receptor subunit TctC